jgi:hypothetical protein
MAISTSMTKDIQFCGSIDEAPSLPGAYMIAIAKTIVVTLGGRAAIDLPAGRYLFIAARLKGRAD